MKAKKANIRIFQSSMVEFSRIDKENGNRSIFIEKIHKYSFKPFV